jgi:peptidoglycan biosynthesis protein MviN/MurJ (putative lipid II flippase)
MGVANTMSAAFNVYFLLYGLRRKLKQLQIGRLPSLIARMLAVGFTAGVTAWITSHYWEIWIGHRHFLARLGAVFVPIGAATLVYFALLAWLRAPQVHDVLALFTQKLRGPSKRPENK